MGKDLQSGRDLFLMKINRVSDPYGPIALPSPYFASLIVWDAYDAPTATIVELAERLLNAGCCYFCTWGVDCERVHDLIDEARDAKYANATDSSIVMTTWHEHETLDDALWYFLRDTMPADDYEEGCRAGLAVSVGNDQTRLDRIHFALEHPETFITEVLDEEAT